MKIFCSLFIFILIFAPITYSETINLYITGGSKAQLEAVKKMGGLESRAGFFQEVVNQATPSIIIEAGGFLPVMIDDQIDQANAEMYSKAMNQLPYELVGLSVDDLSLGKSMIQNIQSSIGQKFLATNIDTIAEDGPIIKTQIIQKADITFGFVSLPILQDGVSMNEGDFLSTDPYEIDATIKQLKEDDGVDLVVLFSMQPPSSVLEWFTTYEGSMPDLIVVENLDIRIQKPREVWMTNAPDNGNSVAKVTLKINEDKQIADAEFQRIILNSEEYYNDSMRDFLLDQYDQYVEKLDLDVSGPYPLMDNELEQDYMSGYAGADSCLECHEDIYQQWAGTKHATTFEDLLQTNQHWVPEKVMYRVTGYGHSTGYDNMTDSSHLLGVQCETCHGPGQVHIDEFGTGEIRRGESKEMCMECHTPDWDPEFEELFDLYIKQVDH